MGSTSVTALFSFLTFWLARERRLWEVSTGSHFRQLALRLPPRESRAFLRPRSKGDRQDTTQGLTCGQPPSMQQNPNRPIIEDDANEKMDGTVHHRYVGRSSGDARGGPGSKGWMQSTHRQFLEQVGDGYQRRHHR